MTKDEMETIYTHNLNVENFIKKYGKERLYLSPYHNNSKLIKKSLEKSGYKVHIYRCKVIID